MITENTKIVDCELSIHIKKVLNNSNIETVKEVLDIGLKDLQKYRGLGKRSLLEIVVFMNDNGFYFNN